MSTCIIKSLLLNVDGWKDRKIILRRVKHSWGRASSWITSWRKWRSFAQLRNLPAATSGTVGSCFKILEKWWNMWRQEDLSNSGNIWPIFGCRLYWVYTVDAEFCDEIFILEHFLRSTNPADFSQFGKIFNVAKHCWNFSKTNFSPKRFARHLSLKRWNGLFTTLSNSLSSCEIVQRFTGVRCYRFIFHISSPIVIVMWISDCRNLKCLYGIRRGYLKRTLTTRQNMSLTQPEERHKAQAAESCEHIGW